MSEGIATKERTIPYISSVSAIRYSMYIQHLHSCLYLLTHLDVSASCPNSLIHLFIHSALSPAHICIYVSMSIEWVPRFVLCTFIDIEWIDMYCDYQK